VIFLFVPAYEPRKIAHALDTSSDAVILDLEDAVPEARKAEARREASQCLARAGPPHGPALWVRINATDPEFEQDIAPLKDNEISEPFKTQFGWHIAQMLGHRRIDNSDELRRRQAMEAIRASKADEATELWLRQMRDEAYVEYKS